MKATINGVAVEGTPQEIMEYQQLQDDGAKEKYRKILNDIEQKRINAFDEHIKKIRSFKPMM